MAATRTPRTAAPATPTSASSSLLPFVQLEYAGRLGLADGRYPARDEEHGERVLIVQTLGVPHPGRKRRRPKRRAKPVDPPAHPEEVPVTRVTVARGTPFDGEPAASAWLEKTAGDGKARSSEARGALELLNRALDALRAAAEDPLVSEVGLNGALAIRLGYGSGEQLADGRWTEAHQLPDPPPPRHLELDPQQQVAEKLAGRTEPEN